MLDFSVSIVIVNYNVNDLILACLKSIYEFSDKALKIEIIVVDNNSHDDSCEAIKSNFPGVILVENKSNDGFPKANNQGFRIASGDLIFMLNPDTEFVEDSISKMLSFFSKEKNIDILAPKLLNSDKTNQQSIWRYPSLKSVFCEMNYLSFWLKKKNYLDKNKAENFEIESCSGAAILFKKNILKQIGSLDETMFWIEDIDFCYRANKSNLKLIYFPETKIIHHIGQSAKKNYKISLSNQIFNKIKFFKKHYSFASFFLVTLLSIYHVLIKIFIFGLLSPFKKVYFRKFQAYIYTFPKVFNPPKGIK